MSEGIQKGDFSHASPKPIINIVQNASLFLTLSVPIKSLLLYLISCKQIKK